MIQSNASMPNLNSLKNRINAIKPIVIYLSLIIKKNIFLPIVDEVIEIIGVENGNYSINTIFKNT
jgi:hypothetical protein